MRELSCDRTFRTPFRTPPDSPDTFSDTIPDTIGHHFGQSPDSLSDTAGHRRTQIGQPHVRLCPECPECDRTPRTPRTPDLDQLWPLLHNALKLLLTIALSSLLLKPVQHNVMGWD